MGVYVIEAGPGGPVKIGKARDAEKRLRALQTAHHAELRLLAFVPTDEDAWLEGLLHRTFAGERIRGEWFRRTPELEEAVRDMRRGRDLPGTFESLCSSDARLADLAREARDEAARAYRLPTVCREWLFTRRFEPRLELLTGWGRRPPGGPLATRAAYDEAERGLRELLPDCRGCLHVV